MPLNSSWSYSVDTLNTLRPEVPEGDPKNGDEDLLSNETSSLSFGSNDGSSRFDDDETRTLTDVSLLPSISRAPQSLLKSRIAPPSGFGRSGTSLGIGLGTFLGPSAADRQNPNLFILTFEREDLLETSLCAPGGKTVYVVSTKTDSKGPNVPATGWTTSFFRTGSNYPIAAFTRTKTGAEMIAFGEKASIKRSDWLKINRLGPFQKGVASFKFDGSNYDWIKQHEKDNNITLELHSSTGSSAVATYKDSRRDWSIPPPDLVIHQARIEITSPGLPMIDEIVISLILTEIIRKKAKLQMDARALVANFGPM